MNPFSSNPPKKLYIIANWMQGVGLSGADRIFIELSRQWITAFRIRLLISQEGWKTCQREGLGNFDHDLWASDRFRYWGYAVDYIYRTWVGLKRALAFRPEPSGIIYSSSDFLPDTLPALIIKKKNPTVRWVAGFYLFAPGPWSKSSPYKGFKRALGFFYWLSQRLAYWLVKKYADVVFVTSQPDAARFVTRTRDIKRVLVVKGGVDIPSVCLSNRNVPERQRKFDACFVGRFHYQKGALELIDIWKIVSKAQPEARLAMIGNGPLEAKVRQKIFKLGLKDKIELLGYKDGQEKFEIFQNSKIIVHPATYDSGGMAAAEAMAWGLPGVSFDLEALRTYYPKGMLKTPCFDIQKFADNILLLLTDWDLYHRVSQEALVMIRQEWGWDQRAEQILKQLYTGLNIS